MDSAMTEAAPWQDVGYRCPRPGFFLGDNGCGMQNSAVLLDDDALPASHHLGQLGSLPVELLYQIVGELAEDDVRSLVNLRNVNRATAEIVGSYRDFATVAAFPRALAALTLLTPANSPSISLSALATCLRSTACASCQRLRQHEQAHGYATEKTVSYGDYIYLLTPERVCYSCFRSQPEYLPVAKFATGTSDPGPADELLDDTKQIAKMCVPAGRYGVLSRITQPVVLYDRRQVYGQESQENQQHGQAQQQQPQQQQQQQPQQASPSPLLHDPKRGFVRVKPTRPDPVRYAAVIPGPYWETPDSCDNGQYRWTKDLSLDRGYACRACAQVDRAHGHAGWADPLARYTREGLRRHIEEDARFGGRVLRSRDPRTGADIYQHDAPRLGHFPPPVEFGASADFARKYETTTPMAGMVSGITV